MTNLKQLFKNQYILFLCASTLIIGCTDGKQQEIDKLNKQVDSLLQDNANKDSDIKDMMSFVGVMADGLDSIAQKENMLFYTNKGKEGTIVDRTQLKKNLEMFENTIAEQKQRIAQMADSLKARGARLQKLTALVDYLNKQLDEKDNIIKSLRADLDKKNVNIAQLRSTVTSLNENKTQLEQTVERQVQALSAQTEMINEAYVMIDTKKALAERGVITSGLLKKTKVNYNALQKSQFKKVDIRSYTEVQINSGNPKILTQMPASSYRIVNNGATSTLYISDPTAFWSVSNFLVIQTK